MFGNEPAELEQGNSMQSPVHADLRDDATVLMTPDSVQEQLKRAGQGRPVTPRLEAVSAYPAIELGPPSASPHQSVKRLVESGFEPDRRSPRFAAGVQDWELLYGKSAFRTLRHKLNNRPRPTPARQSGAEKEARGTTLSRSGWVSLTQTDICGRIILWSSVANVRRTCYGLVRLIDDHQLCPLSTVTST